MHLRLSKPGPIKGLDGRVVRTSVSGAVDSGLILSRIKPMTLKLAFTACLLDAPMKGTVWRTSRQVYLLCRWERHRAGFPHFGVVDRTRTIDRRKLTASQLTAKNSSVRCIVAKMLRALNNLTRLENRLTAGSRFG